MPTFLDWLYPPKCVVCHDILPLVKSPSSAAPRGFCEHCTDALHRIAEPLCERCGRPRAQNRACECDGRDIPLVKNRSVFRYDRAMTDVIHAFKYGGHPAHGKALGRIMADDFSQHFAEAGISRIVPVPMYRPKERRRGFNQAALLAREIAERTKLVYDTRSLVRCRDTLPQSELSAAERRKNLAGAFVYVPGKHAVAGNILLVDDVYTTGSTLGECAAELLRGGAAAVYGYTLAAALKN